MVGVAVTNKPSTATPNAVNQNRAGHVRKFAGRDSESGHHAERFFRGAGVVVLSSQASTAARLSLMYFPIRMWGRGLTQLRRVLLVTHPRVT